jgi:hypothetical protein
MRMTAGGQEVGEYPVLVVVITLIHRWLWITSSSE